MTATLLSTLEICGRILGTIVVEVTAPLLRKHQPVFLSALTFNPCSGCY